MASLEVKKGKRREKKRIEEEEEVKEVKEYNYKNDKEVNKKEDSKEEDSKEVDLSFLSTSNLTNNISIATTSNSISTVSNSISSPLYAQDRKENVVPSTPQPNFHLLPSIYSNVDYSDLLKRNSGLESNLLQSSQLQVNRLQSSQLQPNQLESNQLMHEQLDIKDIDSRSILNKDSNVSNIIEEEDIEPGLEIKIVDKQEIDKIYIPPEVKFPSLINSLISNKYISKSIVSSMPAISNQSNNCVMETPADVITESKVDNRSEYKPIYISNARISELKAEYNDVFIDLSHTMPALLSDKILSDSIFHLEELTMLDNQKRLLSKPNKDSLFYRLLKECKDAGDLNLMNKSSINDLNLKEDNLRKDLWRIDKRTVVVNGTCYHGSSLKHVESFDSAVFNDKDFNNYINFTHDLDLKRLLGITSSTESVISYRLYVEFYIHHTLLRLKGEAGSNEVSESILNECRDIISYLFHFEFLLCNKNNLEPIDNNLSFEIFIHNCLNIAIDALYRVGNISDHRFVLANAVSIRGITNWSSVIQFPPEIINSPKLSQIFESNQNFESSYIVQDYNQCINEAFNKSKDLWPISLRSHFIEMMSVLLHIRFSSSTNEIGGYSIEVEDKNEWIALDSTRINEIDNDDICRKFTLNESDYINLFNSFPLQSFLEITFIDAFVGSSGLNKLLVSTNQAFATCKILLKLFTIALNSIPEYPQFSKVLAQAITFVSWTAVNAWQAIAPYRLLPLEHKTTLMVLFQRELDWLIMRSCLFILNSPQSGSLFFLGKFPFEALSSEAAGQILLAIFWHRNNDYFNNSGTVFRPLDLSSWISLIESNNHKRRKTFSNNIASKGAAAVHILNAMQSLAFKASGDLLQIWLIELFYLGFVEEATREILFNECQQMCVEICCNSKNISLLLSLVFLNFKFIESVALVIFKQINLRNWIPKPIDLIHIQSFLFQDFSSSASCLAIFLLENINTGYIAESSSQLEQIKNTYVDNDTPGHFTASKNTIRLALLPSIHRELFFLLFEVRIVHLFLYKRSNIFGGFQSFDDALWIKVLLSLQAVDSSGQLFIPCLEFSLLEQLKFKLEKGEFFNNLICRNNLILNAETLLHSLDENYNYLISHSYIFSTSQSIGSNSMKSVIANKSLNNVQNSLSSSPIQKSEVEFLIFDPVLTYINCQVSNVFTEIVGITENDKLFESIFALFFTQQQYIQLLFRIFHDLLPRLLLFNSLSDVVKINILFKFINFDKPQGLYSFFTSRYKTHNSTACLLENIYSHILNHVAVDKNVLQMYNTNILKFWLESISNYNSEDFWIKDHNVRVILDQITLVVLLNRNARSLLELSEFFFVQSKRLCSPLKLAAIEMQYAPMPSLVEFYTPKEGACYYSWMTFYCLFDQSLQNMNGWNGLGQLLVSYPLSVPAKDILKRESIGKDLFWNSLIRKWANVVLLIDTTNPLLVLYWQMFFVLYFSKCDGPYGDGNESGIFGYRLLEGNSGNSLKSEVISRMMQIIDYFAKAQIELKLKQINLPNYMEILLNLFKAMLLWLKAINPSELISRKSSLILPSRLLSLVNDPVLKYGSICWNNLWWDLVNTSSIWNSLEYSSIVNFPTVRILFKEEFRSIHDPLLDFSVANKKSIDPILHPFLYPSLISLTVEPDIKLFNINKFANLEVSITNSSQIKISMNSNLSQCTLGCEVLHVFSPPSLIWNLPRSVAVGCYFDLSLPLQAVMPDVDEIPDTFNNDSQWGHSFFGDNELSSVIVTILRASQSFNERTNRQKCLSTQLFEYIPIIWRNVPAVKRVEVSCGPYSKSHPGNNHTSFDINISNPVFNDVVSSNILSTIENLKLGSECRETDTALCSALLQLQRIVNFLKDEGEVLKPTLKTELFHFCDGIKSYDKFKLSNFGIKWLFALIDLEREEIYNFPPSKELVSNCISNLAYFIPKGIGTFPIQESLLRKMIDHPRLVSKLAHVFSPNDNSIEFMDLFRISTKFIHSEISLETNNLISIFNRFNFIKFIRAMSPSLSELHEIYDFSLKVISMEHLYLLKGIGQIRLHNSLIDYFKCILPILLASSSALFVDFVEIFFKNLDSGIFPDSLCAVLAEASIELLSYYDFTRICAIASNFCVNIRLSDLNMAGNSKSVSCLYSKCSKNLIVISKIYNWIHKCFVFYSKRGNSDDLFLLWWDLYSVWIVNFIPKRNNGIYQLQAAMSDVDLPLAIEFIIPNFIESLDIISSISSRIIIFKLFNDQILIEPQVNPFCCWSQAFLELDWSKLIFNQESLDMVNLSLNKSLLLSPKQDGYYKTFASIYDRNLIKQLAMFYSKILSSSIIDAGADININAYLIVLIKLYLLLPSPLPSWFIFLMDSLLVENHPLFKQLSEITRANYEILLTDCSSLLYSNFSNLTENNAKDASNRLDYIILYLLNSSTLDATAEYSLSIKRVNIFCSWILSSFQLNGPPRLLSSDQYLILISNIFSVFQIQIDYKNAEQTDISEFFNLYFTIVNSFENAPQGFYPLKILNLYLSYPFKNMIILEELLKSSSNFIQSMFTLCKSLEIITLRYLENSLDSWDYLSNTILLPVTREKEFIDTCLNCGFSLLLTFYFSKKLKFMIKSQNIVEYKSACDQIDLCLCSIIVDPTIESHFLAFISLYFNALFAIFKFPSPASNYNFFTKHLYSILLNISRLGFDRKKEGFFGFVGLGEKSKNSVNFRLICRSIELFLNLQSDKNNCYKISYFTQPIDEKPSKIRDKFLSTFSSLLEDLTYSPSRDFITNVYAWITNNSINNVYLSVDKINELFELISKIYGETWAINNIGSIKYML